MKTTGRAIAAIMLMFATVLTVGCKKENKCNCNLNEGDWVDLGLPSGLLWATRNVGASSPTDCGDYFAWGETLPKSVYNWSTYKYCVYDNSDPYHDPYYLTKYCYDSYEGYNGFTDGLTTLQPGDDAATVNYGGRTPTPAEWGELIDNTINREVTINGVNGRCFTGSNGNSLFLPAAGSYDNENYSITNDSVMSYGKVGLYWSSSLYVDDNNPYPGKGAWTCAFRTGDLFVGGWGWLDRCLGFSVRAVR